MPENDERPKKCKAEQHTMAKGQAISLFMCRGKLLLKLVSIKENLETWLVLDPFSNNVSTSEFTPAQRKGADRLWYHPSGHAPKKGSSCIS